MPEASQTEVQHAIDAAYRSDWSRILASVLRVSRGLDIAEDCVSEAFAVAAQRWGHDGIPTNPAAWLTTVAVRESLQQRRRATTLATKLPLLIPDAEAESYSAATDFDRLADDRLRLIFTCCHPALDPDAQIALTLRLVCGLTSPEVASALLVKPATMQARITRAKKKIVHAGIPYRVPSATELPARRDVVLDVIHLVYSAGHVAPQGDSLIRRDLADRALELAAVLRELLPDDPEVMSLQALLLLTDARSDARIDEAGELVSLREQDRSRWDAAQSADGIRLLRNAFAAGADSRFATMAAIAAVHAQAATAPETDWDQITRLYDVLGVQWPSPVVELNRAVAIGQSRGAAAGLRALDELSADPSLQSYRYVAAARGEMLLELGRRPEAKAAFEAALALTDNDAERRHLGRRIAQT